MKKRILQFLSYVLVAALATGITLVLCMPTPAQAGISKLEQLEALILEKFIGEADVTAMEDGAADGMVAALGDRWSYYIPASEYQAYQEQMANSYVGVGITITLREDGFLDVEKVEAGGPAEEAGIRVGDVLTAVEGVSIAELGIDETKNRIRGEAGTQVNITLLRGEETLTVTVARRQIQTAVATAEMLDGNVGLVTIVNFDSRCASETIAAIETLTAQGAQALIFDVRFNPGGYKHELVKILDHLLPEGPLFISEDYTGEQTIDTSDAEYLDIPMAVLVNGESYSAAEFFAAALREYDAAVVVGQPTSGKGYFQNTFLLDDGSAVGLSVGKYYTPKGVSLAGVGITPDVVVEVDTDTMADIYADQLPSAEDPQILAALQALTENK